MKKSTRIHTSRPSKHRAANALYIVTLLFFALGLVNMFFAWLGLICFALPFVLLIKNKHKTWCSTYCPRASLFNRLLSRISRHTNPPRWLVGKDARDYVLIYFGVNLFVAILSTVMVFKGRVDALDSLRLLMVWQVPWEVPQLLDLPGIPPWSVHATFRIYSIFLTSTLVGLLLGLLFKPRTWCAICPVGTVSSKYLTQYKRRHHE